MSPLLNAPTQKWMTPCPVLLSPLPSTVCPHPPWQQLQQQLALMQSAALAAYILMIAAFWPAALQQDWALQPLGRPLCQMMTHMHGPKSCGAFLIRFAPTSQPFPTFSPHSLCFFACAIFPCMLSTVSTCFPSATCHCVPVNAPWCDRSLPLQLNHYSSAVLWCMLSMTWPFSHCCHELLSVMRLPQLCYE